MTLKLPVALVWLLSAFFAFGGSELAAARPAAPTNLSVGVKNISGNNRFFVFLWEDNSSDETGFRIETKFGNGNFAPLGGATVEPNSESLQGEISWPNGLTVQFRVAAFNSSGVSYSNVISRTMGANTFAPPTGLTATAVNDSIIRLNWTDASNTDDGVEIEMRKVGDAQFEVLGDWDFAYTPSVNISELLANTSYEFRLRAFRYTAPGSSTKQYTAYSSIVRRATNNIPTGLAVTGTNETTLRFNWSDTFSGELGYEIIYGVKPSSGETEFYHLHRSAANQTSATIKDWIPGITYEFKIRAISVTNGVTVASEFSNVVTFTVPFYKPTTLAVSAATTGTTATLTWQDKSSVETGYEILVRAAGGQQQFVLWEDAAANQKTITLTELPPGTPIEFAVRGFHEFMVEGQPHYTFTDISNTVTGVTKDGVSSLKYAGGLTGQPFSYQLSTTNISPRTSWSVTNLPAGLNFDSATGLISGVPQSRGVYQCSVVANFANGWIEQDTITIRVSAAPAAPVVLADLGQQITKTGGQISLNLAAAYQDADTESAVTVTTNTGNFSIILYDTAAPQTVANFLGYVNDPDATDNYNNSLIHHAAPGFVVQGGGYKMITSNQFTSIPSKPSPVNEPGLPNLRGTVSMAKLADRPNSATNQFFVNLVNNASNLDYQNGGFTVFGRVAGGMNVLDQIASLPRSTFTATVDGQSLPFENFPRTTSPVENVRIQSVSPVPALSFAITANSDPAVVSAGISGGILQLTGLSSGTSNISYTVTDLDGNVLNRQLGVVVDPTFSRWLATSNLLIDDQNASADPDEDGITNLEEYAYLGSATAANTTEIQPQLVLESRDGASHLGIKFRLSKLASDLNYVVQSSDSLANPTWQTIWSWHSNSVAPTGSGINSPLRIQEHSDYYEVAILDETSITASNRGFLRVVIEVDAPPP